jgi:hypothetical protein
LPWPKKHLTAASLTLNSIRNWLGVIFGALLYMAQRPDP